MSNDSPHSAETRRRRLIAALMLVLLAASTAAAVWVADRRGPAAVSGGVEMELTRQSVGVFEFDRPAAWRKVIVDEASGNGAVAGASVMSFEATDHVQHQLITADMRFGGIVLPHVALGTVMQHMVRGTAQIRGTWPIRIGPMTGLVGMADLLDERGQFRSVTLAVMTLDGERYFGLCISAISMGDSMDALLADRILRSVADERYREPTSTAQLAADANLSLPTGLSVLQPASASPSPQDQAAAAARPLLVTPTKSLHFFITPIQMIDLPTAAAALSQTAMDEANEGDLPPELAQNLVQTAKLEPIQQVEMLLTWQYWKLTHRLPGRGDGAAVQVAGRSVRALVIRSGRGATAYHSMWGVLLDSRHMLTMQLIAEPGAIPQVQAEARAVISGVELSTAPPPQTDDDAGTR